MSLRNCLKTSNSPKYAVADELVNGGHTTSAHALAEVYATLTGDARVLAGHSVVRASWEGFVIENLLGCAPPRTEAAFYRSASGAEVDLVLIFRDGRSWAVEIKRGLSPVLSPGFYSALEDIKPDKSFVVYGGDERYRLKAEIEAIPLPDLQRELLNA